MVRSESEDQVVNKEEIEEKEIKETRNEISKMS